MSAPPGPGPSAVPDLLMSLIRDPLDPGYATAAEARSRTGRTARTERGHRALAGAGAFVIGLLLVVAYDHEQDTAPRRAALQEELVAQVEQAVAVTEDLDATAQELADEVRALRDAANPGAAGARSLASLEIAAGARAVVGPGMRVELADAPAPSASGPDDTDGTDDGAGRSGIPGAYPAGSIGDRELRSVVNALWAGGAEAIAVNGVRLTATTAIRFAGEVVLVDFRPITSPYRVEAVGDPERLAVSFADSAVASALRTLDAVGALRFDAQSVDRLSLPAAAVGAPDYAADAAAPSEAPTESPSPAGPVPSGSPS